MRAVTRSLAVLFLVADLAGCGDDSSSIVDAALPVPVDAVACAPEGATCSEANPCCGTFACTGEQVDSGNPLGTCTLPP